MNEASKVGPPNGRREFFKKALAGVIGAVLGLATTRSTLLGGVVLLVAYSYHGPTIYKATSEVRFSSNEPPRTESESGPPARWPLKANQ